MKQKGIVRILSSLLFMILAIGICSADSFATQSKKQNFNTNYTLGTQGVDNIVAVAMAQVGKNGSNLGYTEEWCADFISDCADLAGEGAAIPRTGGVDLLARYVINAGGSNVSGIPQKGDLAIYDWNGTKKYAHVELVYDVKGTTVYTIGGNSGTNASLYTRVVKTHSFAYTSSNFTCFVRPKYRNRISDTQAPTISNVQVTDVSYSGYTVTCNISDNIGVTRVQVPTWTNKNGQDDIVWHDATISGNTATCVINYAQHNFEMGEYVSHIYAWDAAGNNAVFSTGATLIHPSASDMITNISVTTSPYLEANDFGYNKKVTIKGTVKALVPIKAQKMFTAYRVYECENKNGPLDHFSYSYGGSGNIQPAGGSWDFEYDYLVYEHTQEIHESANGGPLKNSRGDTQCSHKVTFSITYWGADDEKYSLVIGPYIMDSYNPIISNAVIIPDKDGYTVQCKVQDYSLTKVQFPSWTLNNGQDDIVDDWPNNPAATGVNIGDGVYTYRVNYSDKNNEYGTYCTHIYAYDQCGNYTCVTLSFDRKQLNHVDFEPATCTQNGHIEYWQANDGTYYADEAGANQINIADTIIYGMHDSNEVMYINGKRLTKSVYKCNSCERYYSDKDCKYELSADKLLNLIDVSKPTISDVKVSSISKDGYTVTCTIKDNVGVTKVEFPTYTEGSSLSKAVYHKGTINGNSVTATIKVSSHNNKRGCNYYTRIYAYDENGNKAEYNSLAKIAVPDGLKDISKCSISLSKTRITYDSAKKNTGFKPTVNVSGLKANVDYKVSYSNYKAIGKATVIVKGIGKYKGEKKLTYEIVPKATSIVSLKATTKALTVTWKKVSTDYTGYQIQYATSSNFKSGAKAVTVKSKTATSRTISSLKSGKNYYVRVRVYKTVSGKNYYSDWSNAKKINVK